MEEKDAKERSRNVEKPDERAPRQHDPYASPLGRGADPGTIEATAPLSGGASIAGQRGAGSNGERGGPAGFVDRENEDSVQVARDAASPGYDSAPQAEDA